MMSGGQGPESPPPPYDAVLLVSFGGPESPDDVMAFLEGIVRGKNVPRQRLDRIAQHYEPFDGVSPANAENRALLAALVAQLNAHGPALAVYWGNRHWHPLLVDTLRQMADDGIRRAVALVTSAYSSYPGCRQYLEAIAAARAQIGPDVPQVDKLRPYFDHPGFIEPMAEHAREAFEQIPPERHATTRLIFTAHSIPIAMARSCDYEKQLREACRQVSERIGQTPGELAYQSRSGPPSQPWLEPDVSATVRELADAGSVTDVVVVPIGFVYEQMETVYDLDVELHGLCHALGLNMVRSSTPGGHPRFVEMVRELIEERIARRGCPSCPDDCCLPG